MPYYFKSIYTATLFQEDSYPEKGT